MSKRTVWVGLAAPVVFGIGWYLFRPELLFVNKSVSEALPAAQAAGRTDQPTVLASGKFHSGAHKTEGEAAIYQVGRKQVLRLTGFETSNGPDVHVFLVAAPDAKDNDTVKKAGFVDVSSLKGNQGDQNYDLPAGVDLNRYRAVTIWCSRFSVNFGTAPLARTQG